MTVVCVCQTCHIKTELKTELTTQAPIKLRTSLTYTHKPNFHITTLLCCSNIQTHKLHRTRFITKPENIQDSINLLAHLMKFKNLAYCNAVYITTKQN